MKKFLSILALLPSIVCAEPMQAPKIQLEGKDPGWEQIQAPYYSVMGGATMHRASVPHGWLVSTGYMYTYTTVFVPDENHEWQLK